MAELKTEQVPNYYCHDPEIAALAKRLGITNAEIINRAYSIGEAAGYGDGVEAAAEYLASQTKNKAGKK
jgi:hypothetical protein